MHGGSAKLHHSRAGQTGIKDILELKGNVKHKGCGEWSSNSLYRAIQANC